MGMRTVCLRFIYLSKFGCDRWQTGTPNQLIQPAWWIIRPWLRLYIHDIRGDIGMYNSAAWFLSEMDVLSGNRDSTEYFGLWKQNAHKHNCIMMLNDRLQFWTFAVFQCNDTILLCALAIVCIGHTTAGKNWCDGSSMHDYADSSCVGCIWSKHMDG